MPIWQVLIGNLTSVALIISLWAHISYKFYRLSKRQLKLYFGITLGICVVTSMLLSVPLLPGLFFDLRVSLMLISAVFGGPISIAVTAVSAAVFRFCLGGMGATPALVGISLTSVAGLLIHYAFRKYMLRSAGLILLALFSAVLSVALLRMLPAGIYQEAMVKIAWPVALLNFFTTLVVGFGIVYFTKFTLERDILRAALTQAPDFHYVKNLNGRFVVTNLNVARHNGRQKSSEMVGLSDFDLSPERAPALFAAEQELISSGEPIIDREEMLPDANGTPRWFTTSKVVLRNRHGDTIGLTGVTRDITERKRLEQELTSSRNLMSQAMAEMSDGLAMFDANGILVLCNEQYQAFFPRSSYARKPGAHISDIVRAVARNGERKDVASDVSEEWIQNAARSLHSNKDEEIPLFDGRWLSMRTRMSQDGASSLVVVSDISTIKASEQSLKQLADRMKGLAESDGLTGLANRRTFDEAIARETTRSLKQGTPLTLLLIDVDRFKMYNDTYGHPAGDLCLKRVSECLSNIARRPSDLAARYGGEEFAVLLPNTSLIEGWDLAERFRRQLQDLAMVHAGSEFGVVTASIGIASNVGGTVLTPEELVTTADASLYAAKRKGRNCTGGVETSFRHSN
jgi:diguanylate cyclase (GGDEF)-like protein/PAS domain S-box-containing protein